MRAESCDNSIVAARSPEQRRYGGRIALKVRVLVPYRAPLYDLLAQQCDGGLFVAAGKPTAQETISVCDRLDRASFRALQNTYFLGGALGGYWQRGGKQWLKEVNPDALLVEANPRCLDTHVLRQIAHERNIPVIGWGLGTLSLADGFESLRSAWRKRFVRGFDAMLCYSTRAAEEYVAAGLPRHSVYVTHNAVSPRPTQAMPVRGSLASLADAKILFVGRLIEWKRVDELIRACAAAFPLDRPELIVVGDGPMRAEYERLARSVYPRTSFPGEQRGAALASLFTSADLFVLPARGGLAIQEAMAYGLPVIASDADGTEQDLVRESNGWLLPECSAQALTTALRDAFSDLQRLRAMGAQSYRIVSDEINLESLAGSILAAVETVTAVRRSRKTG